MAFFILLFPLNVPPFLFLLTPSLSGARTRLLSSRPSTTTMAFFLLLTSPCVCLSILLLSSGSQALPSGALRRSQALGLTSEGFFHARLSFGNHVTWGASPFLFSSPLSPASCPCSSSFSFSPPPLSAGASRVPSLSFLYL